MLGNYIRRIVWEVLREQAQKPKPIGMALFRSYTSCMGMGTTYAHPETPYVGGPGFNAFDYHEFSKKDVEDQVKGKVKIRGVWFKDEEVLFYKNVAVEEYRNRMAKKYKDLSPWTSIHSLYNNGLDVSYGMFGSENHFHDKTLRKQIDQEMSEIGGKKNG